MNAERILGALVREALGGRRRGMVRRRQRRGSAGAFVPGRGMKGMLGMGALGVAIAAFDHFARQQSTSGAQSFGGIPPTPPPQPVTGGPKPPPPPPPTAPPPGIEQESLLLVRAMIAAANADHELDADERQRIVRALAESGLSEAEKSLLLDELERPMDIATLAAKADTPALRRDVYLASEMAIEADSRAEQNYLARLAKQLGLDEAQVAELRRILADAGSRAAPG
jgi:uncharacterized membrane protein YebE (DUF533 family)